MRSYCCNYLKSFSFPSQIIPIKLNKITKKPIVGLNLAFTFKGLKVKYKCLTTGFLLTLAISVHASNVLYNCVDCLYNDDGGASMALYSTFTQDAKITFEQPRNVSVYVQNYSCMSCGLFEVSVRQSPKQLLDTKNNNDSY